MKEALPSKFVNAYTFNIFTEFCKRENANIQNFTKNGKCIKCGECCSNFLPLSLSEIETIRHFVSDHRITANNRRGICPFLNSKRICAIYNIRPLICKLFKCNQKAPSYKDFVLLAKEARDLVNVRNTFFSSDR